MAVAQVVCRPQQGECRGAALTGVSVNTQHLFRRSFDPQQAAVFCDQRIAPTQRAAAGQKDAKVAALRIHRIKAAFAARGPVE